MHSNQFPYPIGLLLFNRPEYSIQLLKSLANQTIKPSDIYIHIDGYKNSRDELFGRPNFQDLTISYINSNFPFAHVVIETENQGIARSWTTLEDLVFKNCHTRYSQFFESDVLLSKFYLELTLKLINKYGNLPKIGAISLAGSNSRLEFKRDSLVNSWGTKAIALNRDHYLERRPLLDQYLASIHGVPYWQRDSEKIINNFREKNLYLNGSSQDHFKIGLLKYFDKLQISTFESYIKDLGRFGFSREIKKDLDDLSGLDLDLDFGSKPDEVKSQLNVPLLTREFSLGFHSAIYEKRGYIPSNVPISYKIIIKLRSKFKKSRWLLSFLRKLRKFERNIRAS